jgi:hypothetical protein
MKPRCLIEAKESVGAELARALERIVALEAWKDQASVIMLRLNERLSLVEDHLNIDAAPELGGQTVRGFAAQVHRSPSTIRKLIRQRLIPFDRVGARVIVAANAALPPRKRRS